MNPLARLKSFLPEQKQANLPARIVKKPYPVPDKKASGTTFFLFYSERFKIIIQFGGESKKQLPPSSSKPARRKQRGRQVVSLGIKAKVDQATGNK